MTKRSLADRLDQWIDTLLASPGAAGPEDPRLAPLAGLAAELADLPSPGFREHLRFELEKRGNMSANAVSPIPKGYHTVTPYLVVQQPAELIDFVKGAFGAEEVFRTSTPGGGTHAEVRIGDSIVMIGGGGAGRTPMPTALHYYVPNVDEVYERAIRMGGEARTGLMEEYGDRFACVRDLAGNDWYIGTHLGPRYTPEGLRDITLYLHPTASRKQIDFLKSAFGAEEIVVYESEGVVPHAKLRVGDSVIEMGDAHGPWQAMPSMVYLYVPDVDAFYARALEAGATSISAPVDHPYGDRSGGVQDPFGNQWYIATHIRDV